MKNSKEHPNFKDKTGEKFITNQGYKIEIINYEGWDKVTVIFEEGYMISDIQYGALKLGTVKNPFHPSVVGVGYYGQGEYKSWDESKKRNYKKE